MKIYKILTKIIWLLLIILTLYSCGNNYTITTKIFRDGSCERIITIKGDSAEIFNGEYPVSEGDGWETNLEIIDEKEEKYLFTAKKHYPDIKSLKNDFFNEENPELKVNSNISLKRRFRWFYTYLNYNEIYETLSPFNRIPAREYFTDEEISLIEDPPDDENLATEEDSLRSDQFDNIFEKKVEKWLLRNTFEELFYIISQGAVKLKSPDITNSTLSQAKEKLIYLIENFDNEISDENEELIELTNQAENDIIDFNTWFLLIEKILDSKDIWKIAESEKSLLEEFSRKYQIIDEYSIFNEYTSNVQMPGLLLSTNAKTIEGNTVSWNFGLLQFLIMDYEMEVESRLINIWAFGLSGLFVLVILTGIIAGILRKRRG